MSVTLPQSYRAWTWQGGKSSSELALREVATAPLASGEVLVRNAVIGLNPVDWKVIGGELVDWQPGKVPGVDGAGVVVAVGDDVPDGWLGQRVAYHQSLARAGSFAEYTPLRAEVLLRVPPGMDFETAASFPCPGLTAWLAIEKVPERTGARLLVSGAGGAVGGYLVQLAAARGFEVVAMCHPRHWPRLRDLGASVCLEGPLAQAASKLDDGVPYFAAIDSVNAEHAARLAPALAANGHLVAIQGRVAEWPCEPFGRALSMHEVALGALHRWGDATDWAWLTRAGERMLGDIVAGHLHAEATHVYDFAALPDALTALEHRKFSGKLLAAV